MLPQFLLWCRQALLRPIPTTVLAAAITRAKAARTTHTPIPIKATTEGISTHLIKGRMVMLPASGMAALLTTRAVITARSTICPAHRMAEGTTAGMAVAVRILAFRVFMPTLALAAGITKKA